MTASERSWRHLAAPHPDGTQQADLVGPLEHESIKCSTIPISAMTTARAQER